jgi:hypothetical protein
LTARIIFSLSALAANLLAGSGVAISQTAPSDSNPRLLRSVAALVISGAEAATPVASFDHRAPQATLALEALTDTHLRGALWLVASVIAVNFFVRRHLRALLRC